MFNANEGIQNAEQLEAIPCTRSTPSSSLLKWWQQWRFKPFQSKPAQPARDATRPQDQQNLRMRQIEDLQEQSRGRLIDDARRDVQPFAPGLETPNLKQLDGGWVYNNFNPFR